MRSSWSVYILRCADDTLYTGVTTDLARRLRAHASGRGARYTRGRGPFVVAHVELVGGRGAALRRELAVKRMARERKEQLITLGARAASRRRAPGSAAPIRRSAVAARGRR